jgi:hypothetical protein
LRIPNSRFVSSQPSFQKSLLIDTLKEEYSDSKNISITSKEEFLIPKINLKRKETNFNFKGDSEKERWFQIKKFDKHKMVVTNSNKTEKLSYYEKKNAYKVLHEIINNNYLKRNCQNNTDSTEPSIKNYNRRNKSLKHHEEEGLINYKSVHEKQDSLSQCIKNNKILELSSEQINNTKSLTIRSSSRSILGPSTDLHINELTTQSSSILKEIPVSKMFHRTYVDKCYACLHKRFKKQNKFTCDSNVHKLDPTSQNISDCSSFTSSISSIIEKKKDRNNDFYNENVINSIEKDENILNSNLSVENQDNGNTKQSLGILFDTRNLNPTLKSNTKTVSPIDQIIIPDLLSDYHSNDQSIPIQSSNYSRTSSLNNESSDFEETQFQQDKSPPLKSTAPCHAPVIWRPSLEPLQALKLKSNISLNTRIADITSILTSDNDTNRFDINAMPSKFENLKKVESTSSEATTCNKEILKNHKQLVRMKSDMNVIGAFSLPENIQKEKKKKLIRAKTLFDITSFANNPQCEESEEEEEENVSVLNQENIDTNLPYFDLITMHRASSPSPSIMSTEDIVYIIKECFKDDFSVTSLIGKLKDEFIKRLEYKYENMNSNQSKKSLKLGLNLFKALIDSRQYIEYHTFNPDLEFSQKQPPIINTRLLRRILTEKSYDLVAPILGIRKPHTIKKADTNKLIQFESTNINSESLDIDFKHPFSLIVCI